MKLENITNSQTLNKFDLHTLDSVVEVNRNVDVGIHLPQDIIGKGAEFSEIRRVENRELTKLWQQMNKVLKNSFIHLADEIGIKAYENLIDDEAIKGSLEDKRKVIYALWNMITLWTHRTLESWLESYLGHKHFNIDIEYNNYNFILEITLNQKINLELLYFQLRYKILPANLTIEIRFKLSEKLILQDKTDTYTNPFYPVGYFHKCGTVFRHQYVGKKLVNNINLKNAGAGRKQRQFNTGEIKSGGVKR